MAGTFTHWMVAETALDQYERLSKKHEYFSKILGNSHFVCLGAVGPDYPYLTELLNGYLKMHSWADRMHYENTGDFIRKGIRNLPEIGTVDFNICLAWLCGFVTHLLTDAVVHPVVQAIVGTYVFNSEDHRHCEMTQDSWIFYDIKSLEIGYANYEGLFKMCSDQNDKKNKKLNPALATFWTKTLKETHPTAEKWFEHITPDIWHDKFLSRISSATDPIPIFRHYEEEKKLAYKTTSELTAEELERFVEKIKMPDNETGKFKEDVFDKAVNTVVETWNKLFKDIEQSKPENTISYIKNWNLDTGVDEDIQFFWSAQKGVV
jgi:hypothetical protein